jgi:hypothetical protein
MSQTQQEKYVFWKKMLSKTSLANVTATFCTIAITLYFIYKGNIEGLGYILGFVLGYLYGRQQAQQR